MAQEKANLSHCFVPKGIEGFKLPPYEQGGKKRWQFEDKMRTETKAGFEKCHFDRMPCRAEGEGGKKCPKVNNNGGKKLVTAARRDQISKKECAFSLPLIV